VEEDEEEAAKKSSDGEAEPQAKAEGGQVEQRSPW